MPIYWSLKNVPELATLSPRERRHVHRTCYMRHGLQSRRTKVALLVCGLCAGSGSAIGSTVPWVFGFPPSIWFQAIGGGIGGLIGGFIYSQVLTEHLRPHYAAYIKNELSHRTA
jgi:hypothetical protein